MLKRICDRGYTIAMRYLIFCAAVLFNFNLGFKAWSAEHNESVDFADSFERATLFPLGDVIVGAVPTGDLDYVAFQLPRQATTQDRYQLAVEIVRVSSPLATRVILYEGPHKLIGNREFVSTESFVLEGQLIGGLPARVVVGVSGVLGLPSPVDTNYHIKLTTTLTVPESTACSLLMIAAIPLIQQRRRNHRLPGQPAPRTASSPSTPRHAV